LYTYFALANGLYVYNRTTPTLVSWPLFQCSMCKLSAERQTILDFNEARSDRQEWNHKQIVCISLQTDNHASTFLVMFLQARCSS